MSKTRRTKRTFSPEFRLEAIEQVVKYQRDVREVALALELNPDHLRKWIRLYKLELQGIEPAGNAIPLNSEKFSSLKAQIKRLEMEKEILKQAAVLLKAKRPVRIICHLFGVHRSVYYAQVKRPVNVSAPMI